MHCKVEPGVLETHSVSSLPWHREPTRKILRQNYKYPHVCPPLQGTAQWPWRGTLASRGCLHQITHLLGGKNVNKSCIGSVNRGTIRKTLYCSRHSLLGDLSKILRRHQSFSCQTLIHTTKNFHCLSSSCICPRGGGRFLPGSLTLLIICFKKKATCSWKLLSWNGVAIYAQKIKGLILFFPFSFLNIYKKEMRKLTKNCKKKKYVILNRIYKDL